MEKLESNSRINYYLDIAETVSERSTCLKKRYGAVIVKNNEIISTGYNGAPRGRTSCMDSGICLRRNIPRGQQYQLCSSVHSEQNAIISASRRDMIGSDLYLCGIEQLTSNYVEEAAPCIMCKKLIINAGIKKVYVRLDKDTFKEYDVNSWLTKISEEDFLGY